MTGLGALRPHWVAVQLAQSLQKSPYYPVERTAGSHRVAAAAHRSVEFMHNDDKDHSTRWPAGELRKVNPSSIMRLSVIPEGDPAARRREQSLVAPNGRDHASSGGLTGLPS